jgi:hypothetical protein
MSNVKASNTVRRSSLPATADVKRLVTTAKIPHTEMACPACPGYHLYYQNRLPTPALTLLVDALRYRS